MQVSIIRDVALVVAANSMIEGHRVAPLWPQSNLFRYSKDCVFLDEIHRVIAADPNVWLDRIANDFDGLWLDYGDRDRSFSDRLTVGFAGGGHRWLIGAVKGETTELWEGGDRLGDRNAKDRKIWSSAYVRLDPDWKGPRPRSRAIAAVVAALDGTLAEIAAFARAQNLNDFAASFSQARSDLKSDPRRDAMLGELFLPEDAAKLWAAIGSAWVFGGMGSWNDRGFDGEDGKTYERLSDTLFAQLNEAVAAVANATWPRKKARQPRTWWQFGRRS